LSGGAFLVEECPPESVFTAEDLTEEHLAIGRTAEEFFRKEIGPNLEALLHQEPGVARRLLRKSAELGLTAISIPEKFGGLELYLASAHFRSSISAAKSKSKSICRGSRALR
jgi:alkylation response protein AidB-like acyl-CoA dehydrogenase